MENEIKRIINNIEQHKHKNHNYWHDISRLHEVEDNDEIIMHKATSMSSTLCNTPTNIAGHGWTNDLKRITCEDCLTIIEIQTRNGVNYFDYGTLSDENE